MLCLHHLLFGKDCISDRKRVVSHENRAKKEEYLKDGQIHYKSWTKSLDLKSDDEGNHDNLEVLKIMRKVEQKVKLRTNKNEIDLITEVDVKCANLESKKKSPPRLVVLKNVDKTISSIYIVRDGLKIYLRGRKRHN